jgi:hypothetical protein
VERRAVVAAAVHALAADPEAAGWRRTSGGADPLAVEGTPDPAVWGTGTTFQRSLETARLHLDELAAIDELGEAMTGGPVPTRATGLGALLTEADMVEVLGVSLPSLRAWRTKRLYFEYLKFPGQRGPVRYTERGLRAFIDSHLNTPVQV